MKKPKFFSLQLCFILSSHFIWAQQNNSLVSKDSLSLQYKTETIHLRFATYVKNDSAFNIGFVGEGLKHEMMISLEAMEVYKKYQKQKRWSLVCTAAQLGLEVAGLTTKNKSQRTGLFIGAAAVSIVTVPLFIGSTKNLNKAVWIRNGEVLR
jgi:hypothetical protein